MEGKQETGCLNRTANQEIASDAEPIACKVNPALVDKPGPSRRFTSFIPAMNVNNMYRTCLQQWKWKWKALLPLRHLRLFSSDSLFIFISCLCVFVLRSNSTLAHSEVHSVLVGAISNHSLTQLHHHICHQLNISLFLFYCLSVQHLHTSNAMLESKFPKCGKNLIIFYSVIINNRLDTPFLHVHEGKTKRRRKIHKIQMFKCLDFQDVSEGLSKSHFCLASGILSQF